jgi:SAM-dependent methyltransferase
MGLIDGEDGLGLLTGPATNADLRPVRPTEECMRSPWLGIPLDDYERHMDHPSVAQAGMLADVLDRAIHESWPQSVGVVCGAGGNGFDRVVSANIRRLVGIDINENYLAAAAGRFAATVPVFEVHCADLEDRLPPIDPVELVYAALVFEYVNVDKALASLHDLCQPGGRLVTVLQRPSGNLSAVSPSPFSTIADLASIFNYVSASQLTRTADSVGFELREHRRVMLESGKEFSVVSFSRER